MSVISFFTPIVFANSPRTCMESALQHVDNLFYFGGKYVEVVPGGEKEKVREVEFKDGNSSMCGMILKAIFCVTIILPIIALVFKFALRSSFTFVVQVDKKEDTVRDANVELKGRDKLYAVRGIDHNPRKEIPQLTCEDLGLDSNESAELKVKHPGLLQFTAPDGKRSESPIFTNHNLKMQDLIDEVIGEINAKLKEEPGEGTEREHRSFAFNTKMTKWKKWHEAGKKEVKPLDPNMSMAFMDQLKDTKSRWLRRVIDALLDRGHIHKYEGFIKECYVFEA